MISMEISQPTADDEGEYKAVVKNAYGQAIPAFNVNLKGMYIIAYHNCLFYFSFKKMKEKMV